MLPRVSRLAVDHLHQPEGWLSPGFLEIDPSGTITAVLDHAPDDWREEEITFAPGFAVPGLPNLHSHAFQRALAGRAEASADPDDSFWTWRTLMYQLALRFEPEELRAVATLLYVEMLEAGMTSVGEFHYLHHAPDGTPYDNPAELGLQLLAAARDSGIGLTLLPVLYQRGGFELPAQPEQRRFVHRDVASFLRLVDALRGAIHGPGERVGIAPHSLRAVTPEALTEVVAAIDPTAPVHIHIAEQTLEVEQCRSRLGARPVEWLLGEQPIDARWCLVHATHVESFEVQRIAASGAIAGLCPTTEASLGDGVFPAVEYFAASGAMGVGSDSHASVSATEELRLLEYGQRLLLRRRNLLGRRDDPLHQHVGRRLWDAACEGGARALGLQTGALRPGRRADVVVLDPEHPRLIGHGPATVLDAWIFGGADGAIRDVLAGGAHVVENGRHFLKERAVRDYARALQRLTGEL